MAPKTLKTAYWIATILFALLLVMDGLGGVRVAFLAMMAVPYFLWKKYQPDRHAEKRGRRAHGRLRPLPSSAGNRGYLTR